MNKNIELEKGLQLIKEELSLLKKERGTEKIHILKSSGRVLGCSIYAEIDNPPFPRSPLDGYTMNSSDFQELKDGKFEFLVKGEIFAGEYYSEKLNKGEALRIMTGAPIPKGCNCVVKQEEAQYCEKTKKVTLTRKLEKFENYIFSGEDFKKGNLMMEKEEVITTNHIGVLASLGIKEVEVEKQLKIGLLSSGDELVEPGDSLTLGKIYNSNKYLIATKLMELGLEVELFNDIKDQPQEVARAIEEKIEGMDLLITTGGVSVGKKDIFHDVIPILGGKRLFWRLNIQPGTPILAWSYKGKLILSLSGNPFAALVNFQLVVKYALNILSKGRVPYLESKLAIVEGSFLKKNKQRRFIRGFFNKKSKKVELEGKKHASGQLSSLIGKNCLIERPKGSLPLEGGEEVKVWIID